MSVEIIVLLINALLALIALYAYISMLVNRIQNRKADRLCSSRKARYKGTFRELIEAGNLATTTVNAYNAAHNDDPCDIRVAWKIAHHSYQTHLLENSKRLNWYESSLTRLLSVSEAEHNTIIDSLLETKYDMDHIRVAVQRHDQESAAVKDQGG